MVMKEDSFIETAWTPSPGEQHIDLTLKEDVLAYCNFESRLFFDCLFYGVSFEHVELQKAYFEGCVFDGCCFDNIDAAEVVFYNCKFINCAVGDGDFNDSYFDSCTIDKSVLENIFAPKAQFHKVRFKRSEVTSCRFVRASFSHTAFMYCNLEGSDFYDAVMPQDTFIARCNITDANFRIADGALANILNNCIFLPYTGRKYIPTPHNTVSQINDNSAHLFSSNSEELRFYCDHSTIRAL